MCYAFLKIYAYLFLALTLTVKVVKLKLKITDNYYNPGTKLSSNHNTFACNPRELKQGTVATV